MHAEEHDPVQKTVLCYGDSNTFGHDPRFPIGARYPRSERWTGRLGSAGWNVINCGLNGRQIPSGEAELAAAAQQLASHLPLRAAAVMLGTNDLLWNAAFRAEDAARRMEIFLRRLGPALGETPLLLIAPPPMERGDWVAEERLLTESRRLAPRYAELAARLGVCFCDAGEWDVGIAFDGVHFTAEGHARFAQRLAAVLDEI